MGGKFDQKANQAKQLQGQINDLENKISQVFAKTNKIIIKQGEAFPLIKNSCFLGVEGVYSSWVEGYLNGEKVNFRVGRGISFMCLGHEGKVVLTKIDSQSDTATFTWSHMEKDNS